MLAPLAAVSPGAELRSGVAAVLDQLDLEDSRLTYRAIRLANPGGLGRSPDQDVADEPTMPLRQVMALAADRDLVARQYADGFATVFDEGVPAPVISAALFSRFQSRGNAGFADKVLSALRKQFGGHEEKHTPGV